MEKVVYLLGAGASADAIPVVNQMSTEIAEDMKEFDHLSSLMENQVYDFRSYRTMVDGILSNLRTACENYYSIDTYAKQLYLTDEEGFKDLKRELSFYFTLRQILKKPDKRYDNFWASVLEEKDKLPDNIRFLSWNYDYQLELTYTNMSSRASLKSAKSALNVHYPSEKIEHHNFSVMKLNGSATTYDHEIRETYYLCEGAKTHNKEVELKQLLEAYIILKTSDRNKSELKFAWESTFKPEIIYNFLAGYKVLVIIGYSFPYFNRNIDKILLDSITKKGDLHHLYIQDKNPNVILERMLQIKGRFYDQITLVKDTEQFVFPIEL